MGTKGSRTSARPSGAIVVRFSDYHFYFASFRRSDPISTRLVFIYAFSMPFRILFLHLTIRLYPCDVNTSVTRWRLLLFWKCVGGIGTVFVLLPPWLPLGHESMIRSFFRLFLSRNFCSISLCLHQFTLTLTINTTQTPGG